MPDGNFVLILLHRLVFLDFHIDYNFKFFSVGVGRKMLAGKGNPGTSCMS